MNESITNSSFDLENGIDNSYYRDIYLYSDNDITDNNEFEEQEEEQTHVITKRDSKNLCLSNQLSIFFSPFIKSGIRQIFNSSICIITIS